jgi:hypothetical protein
MISSPPAKRGEAQRTNGTTFPPFSSPLQYRWASTLKAMTASDRFSTLSPAFASQLYSATGLEPLVKDWPSQFSNSKRTRKAQGLSENIRIYSYREGEFFVSLPCLLSSLPLLGLPSFGLVSSGCLILPCLTFSLRYSSVNDVC